MLLIIPFVERARLVESLVTLQPDELGVQNFREHLGHFGLARAGGTFYQQRLFERECEKDRGLDAFVGDVMRTLEALGDLLVRHVHETYRRLSFGARRRSRKIRARCFRPSRSSRGVARTSSV